MIMNDINSSTTNINNNWKQTIQQLTQYKEISETVLEECDEEFMKTKKNICQDFDTLINYLTDRKIEVITQLEIGLESHKQYLESNRDRATILIEQLNRKINGTDNLIKVGSNGLVKSASNQYLSVSGMSALSSSSSLNYSTSNLFATTSNGSINSSIGGGGVSPLKKSTSFQTDHIKVLKEPISIIQWEWSGEFLVNQSTVAKVVKSPKPIPEFLTQILNINSNGDNISELNQKFQDYQQQISDDSIEDEEYEEYSSYDQEDNGASNHENSSPSSFNISTTPIINSKVLPIFGKLKYNTVTSNEYKILNNQLPSEKCIFSIGGKSTSGYDEYYIEKYDFKEAMWRTLQPPIPSIMDNDFTGNSNGIHCYLFGGSITPTRVIKYNILENQFEKCMDIPDGGRFLHCSVYDEKQYIYLIGGYPRSTKIIKFDLTTERFQPHSKHLKSLWSIGAVYQSSSNSIYLIGGCNITRQSVDTFERYDIDRDEFITLPSLPISCYGSGVVYPSESNYIYVIGGYNSQDNKCLTCIQQYDLLENKWTLLDQPNLQLPKSMIINGNSIVFDNQKNTIFILGGYNNVSKESIDSIYSWDLNLDSNWLINPINPYLNLKSKGGTSILINK